MSTDYAQIANDVITGRGLVRHAAPETTKTSASVAPMLDVDLRGMDVRLRGVRRDTPPKMVSIDYEITIDSSEPNQRIDLVHRNIRKYGTVTNTIAEATRLEGVNHRATK